MEERISLMRENFMENLSDKDPVFAEPEINETKNYVVEDVEVSLEKIDSIKYLKNRKKEIFIILVEV